MAKSALVVEGGAMRSIFAGLKFLSSLSSDETFGLNTENCHFCV